MRTQTLVPLLALLAGQTSAQSLGDAIAGTEELASLGEVLSQFPDLTATLAGLSNITIFAPNNEAISALPSGLGDDILTAVLTYHVAPGTYMSADVGEVTAFLPTLLKDNPSFVNITEGQVLKVKRDKESVIINDGSMVMLRGNALDSGATVMTADVTFDGGVVHIINSVLIPPADLATTLMTSQGDNIDLSTLVEVLSGSSLSDTAQGLSDVTLFAPNNPAWEGMNTSALMPEDVANVLSYHVIQGTVAYSTMLQPGNVTTVQGGDVQIEIGDDGSVMVNGAKVIKADILTASGVVHVIDTVLMPGESAGAGDSDGDDSDGGDSENEGSEDGSEGTVEAAASRLSVVWSLAFVFASLLV